ncbi:MAG: CDP-glycerol--glycerophosphate glycerophosphotransferase, partial [Spirochaetales bacterium]|nr:CDP-glycerol--glycerophosphate glycerophosphotransferase [Spirochaetales bacterium]
MFLFYILFFSFIAVLPAHCYIDPGTGSMLFSVLIGFVSIFFFAAKTALIKIKTLPIWYKKKDGETISSSRKDIVIYSEGKQYWNVFRPVLEEFDRRKISVTFYTSDENDLCFDFKSEFVTTSFIGKGNKAYATLNLLEADIVLMTT